MTIKAWLLACPTSDCAPGFPDPNVGGADWIGMGSFDTDPSDSEMASWAASVTLDYIKRTGRKPVVLRIYIDGVVRLVMR